MTEKNTDEKKLIRTEIESIRTNIRQTEILASKLEELLGEKEIINIKEVKNIINEIKTIQNITKISYENIIRLSDKK